MKQLLLGVLIFCFSSVWAQDSVHIYNPAASAKQDIKAAVNKARKEHKKVFIQVGGNWCIWCIRFHDLMDHNDSLKKIMDENYVTVHLNYSKENKNEQILEELGHPQQFGFPVFVILDSKGKRIHTQNSGDLEEGKGHSPQKVALFLRKWAAFRS